MLSRLRTRYERVSSEPKSPRSPDSDGSFRSDGLLVRVRRRLSARVVRFLFLISFVINAYCSYELAKPWFRRVEEGGVVWRGVLPQYSMPFCIHIIVVAVTHPNITAPVDPPVHEYYVTPAQEGRTPYHEPPTAEVDRLWSDLYAPCELEEFYRIICSVESSECRFVNGD